MLVVPIDGNANTYHCCDNEEVLKNYHIILLVLKFINYNNPSATISKFHSINLLNKEFVGSF